MSNINLYKTQKRDDILKKFIRIVELNQDEYKLFINELVGLINKSELKDSDRIIIAYIINKSDTNEKLLNSLKNYYKYGFIFDEKVIKIMEKTVWI